MAQRSHVPKFGNWEMEDNVPYTAYFDKARRGKAGVKEMINPNDPEENPAAFTHAMKRDKVMEKEDCSLFAHTPQHPRPRRTYAEKYQNNIDADHQQAHNNRDQQPQNIAGQWQQNINTTTTTTNNNNNNHHHHSCIKKNDGNERRNKFRQRSPPDHRRRPPPPPPHHHHDEKSRTLSPGRPSPSSTSSGSQRKSTRWETSSSSQSNSARSLLKHGNSSHRLQKSDRRKTTNLGSTVEDNNSFSMSFMGMAQYFKQRSAARPSQPDIQQHREESLPVPKFGAWDEEDPESAGGFSEIFSRVKEEKASPAVPSRSSGSGGSKKPTPKPKPESRPEKHSSDARRKSRSSSCPPKLCCLSFLRWQ